MYKQAETGLVDLAEQEQSNIEHFTPVGFVLLSLASIMLAMRLETPFLLTVPVTIWFVAVPLWDRIDIRYLRKREMLGPHVKDMSFRQSELIATTAGLTILGILLLIATSTQSIAALIGLTVTSGLLLPMAANPALRYINDEYRLGSRYSLLRAWVFQALLLLPIFSTSARYRHYQAASTQGDESSARMGESYFAFVLRFTVGNIVKSLKIASSDKQISSGPVRRGTDDLTKLSCAAVCILVGASFLSGFSLVVFIVGQAVIALWQITATEYAEHYGMLRKENTGVTEEKSFRPYVWKGKGKLNNALLNGRIEHKPAIGSANHDSAKGFLELPYGFNLLTIIALWPSKWFSLVDARLAESVNFDLHDVNLHGDAYVRLMEKYHHQGGKAT